MADDIFLPPAEAEFRRAARSYARENFTLGETVESAVERLLIAPSADSPYLRGTRRVLLKRFPYSVVYAWRSGRIVIVAVAHQRRRDGYWLRRLPSP